MEFVVSCKAHELLDKIKERGLEMSNENCDYFVWNADKEELEFFDTKEDAIDRFELLMANAKLWEECFAGKIIK